MSETRRESLDDAERLWELEAEEDRRIAVAANDEASLSARWVATETGLRIERRLAVARDVHPPDASPNPCAVLGAALVDRARVISALRAAD